MRLPNHLYCGNWSIGLGNGCLVANDTIGIERSVTPAASIMAVGTLTWEMAAGRRVA